MGWELVLQVWVTLVTFSVVNVPNQTKENCVSMHENIKLWHKKKATKSCGDALPKILKILILYIHDYLTNSSSTYQKVSLRI